MATPYGSSYAELRSVTPATANTRQHTERYPSAPRMGGNSTMATANEPYATARSMTPNRLHHSEDAAMQRDDRGPSSTGLIRLSLKKPMGIVFEPMYDPNQPSVQRGVRICDLPRTGAAALSRKLQVGDELLQINDTTVSRLTFDEIMDFIIEADPESVNLLFRRPRKETLQARQGVKEKLNAAMHKDGPSAVKWVDEENSDEKKSKKKKKKDRKRQKERAPPPVSEEEETQTLQSSTVGDESYSRRSRRKGRNRRDPYESESFLDLLIDTICSNSNNVCRDTFRTRDDDEYFSDEDSFDSAQDESTYVTYEESVEPRHKEHRSSKPDPEVETAEEKHERRRRKEQKESKKKYEDDGTLESVDSEDRMKTVPEVAEEPMQQPPLGLAPPPPPEEETVDDVNPAPIKEVEYDDRIDHGADVSVMESLGGPSLLIEKQRAAAQAKAQAQTVPADIMEKFGLDYPASFGLTREQTIEADPLNYYTYVVKGLLEKHEPEKVRLLDKLLAKYKGREDHLVQKLSVRYNKEESIPEHDEMAFTDAVKKSKHSSTAEAAVNTAKERLQYNVVQEEEEEPEEEIEDEEEEEEPPQYEWPEKEEKEPDEVHEEEQSQSGSEYSGDEVDGTSPAVIAQVSELLNYVYGKTSVPGQIDRVSTIMRAYEGREAVLLELLETKALIKANKEKENAENLPSFLRNSTQVAQKNAEELANDVPPVTPMANHAINDDISSMSGVSSPAQEANHTGIVDQSTSADEVEVTHTPVREEKSSPPSHEAPKMNTSHSARNPNRPPVTPDKDRKKKKGLFGGLFGGKKKEKPATPGRAGSRTRGRLLKGVKSIEGSI